LKKSFIVHIDSLAVLDDLTDEQAGKLFKAMKSHQLQEPLDLDPITKIAFSPFKAQFERDNAKYLQTIEKNKENGKKGGRPTKAKKPTGLSDKPEKPPKGDSDSDSDSKNVSKSDSEVQKTSRFAPPTQQEVGNYFLERGSHNALHESEKFIDFYESKGWMVGRNKMKCWKSAVRNWMKRSNETNQPESQNTQTLLTDRSWADGMVGQDLSLTIKEVI